MRSGNPRVLLVPRARPGRTADVATRAPLIGNQRHPARRIRRARRSLRAVGRVLEPGLVVAAILIIALVAAHWLRTTRLLGVTVVDVTGTRRLGENDVRAAARIEPGTNILALSVGDVEDRVRALQGVRAARVVRDLPSRVTITLEEREAYALMNRRGGDRLFWIDAEGHLVGPEQRPGAPSLPILTGVEGATPRMDHLMPDGLRTGLAFLRAVQRTGGRVARRISEIDVAGTDGPVLYLVDGAEVRIGTASWDERLARLDGVLADLETRGERATSVDLRFRDLVVLKPHKGAPTSPQSRAGGPAPLRRTTAAGRATPTEQR